MGMSEFWLQIAGIYCCTKEERVLLRSPKSKALAVWQAEEPKEDQTTVTAEMLVLHTIPLMIFWENHLAKYLKHTA